MKRGAAASSQPDRENPPNARFVAGSTMLNTRRRTIMRASRLLPIIALLAASLATTTALRGAPHSLAEPQLRLHRSTIDTTRMSRAAATVLGAAAAGPYAIIQFRGPIARGDRDAIEQTGVELLEYLPDYAYLVRGGERQLAAAARVPQVYARLPFTNADKLAPA